MLVGMEIGAATMQKTVVEKIKNRTNKRFSNPTLGYTHKQHNTDWKRNMQRPVHSSSIYKRQLGRSEPTCEWGWDMSPPGPQSQ